MAVRGAPEHQKNQYFHFTPGRGLHDLHMNQGSPQPHARDDGVWLDGGLFVRFPGAATVAFFFAFQSQSWQTDDMTGPATPGCLIAPARSHSIA